MTERPQLTPDQDIEDTKAEIRARKIEEIILSNDPDEVRIAAAVIAHLPHFGVEDDRLVEIHALRDKILLQLGRAGSRQ